MGKGICKRCHKIILNKSGKKDGKKTTCKECDEKIMRGIIRSRR